MRNRERQHTQCRGYYRDRHNIALLVAGVPMIVFSLGLLPVPWLTGDVNAALMATVIAIASLCYLVPVRAAPLRSRRNGTTTCPRHRESSNA